MNRSSSATKDKKKGLNVSSQSLNKSAKKKTSQSQYITLSQALIEYPQGQDETKISVVQKFVNEIDLVPNKFHKIETLYLSSNNIRSLEGLEQFSCLRNLSLANNNIDDAGSLNVLEELPSIEVLNLNGNPICRLPNYRSLIVSMLPCLKSLDGKPVNVDEKYKSEVNLRTQSSLLDLMLRNYCELIKFNSLNKKLEVHKELLARHQRFARNFVPVDVPTWKKSFDFEKMLDSRSKDVLKANLLKDVDTIKGELELRDEENEVAFSELILRQQQKIAELAVRAEESVKNLTTFFTKTSPAKLNDLQLSTPLTIKSSQPSTSALSAKNKPTKALPSDINSASLLDCEPKSLKSILKTNVKTPELHDKTPKLSRSQFGSASTEYLGASRSHTPQAYPRGKDSITFPASTKNAVYTALTAEKPKAISPISSAFEYRGASPMKQAPSGGHKEECCRTLHKKIDNMDIDTVWNSLVDANKTPFKKRLEEKAKLIENLTRDLRLKNQELIKYESINHQLAERLRDFQNQNRENVKVAQFEIDSLTRELETSLEAQKALEEEITVIKAELSELYQRNFDLEVQNQRLHDAEAKADIYAKELENKAIEEALMETAAVFRAKKLKVKGFKMFKKGVKSFKTVNGILECNRIRKQKKLLCLSFSNWKRMTIINGYIKEKNQQKSLNCLKNMFYNWHDYTVNWNKVRGFITETNERKLKKSIIAWKQFSAATYKKNILYKKMQQHFIKKTKKRVFKRFVEIRQRVQYDSKAEKTAVKKAQNHKAVATKARLFAAWKKWTKVEAKPLRLKNEKSDKLRNKNLLKFGLKVWTNYMKVNDKVLAKAQRKIARKNLELTAKYLKAWKYFFNTVIPQNKLQEAKKEMFIKKRLLKRWVDQLEAKKKVNACVDKATELHNKHLTQRVFKHLAKLRLKRKQLHFFKNAIETKATHSKKSQYFSKWSVLFKKVKESKKEANDVRVESLSTFFKAWKSFHKTALAKKIKALKVEKHLIRAEKNHTANIWNGWLNYSRLRRRNRDVLELLASRKKATICKNVVFELVKNAKQSLRLKINKMMAKSTLLQAHMRDNNEYVRGLDEERNEMNARTNQYKHELTEATLQLEDKNREINNLRRLVQQYEKNEKNLLEEVTFKNSLTKDLETRFQRNTSENQFVYGEFEKEVELLKNEKAALQKKIVSLEENLDCKQQALKDAERALVEKSNQAQGLITEAERRAANSVKMAGELRNEAEIKEEEVSSLLARLQMSNEEKQELKDKLAEALEAVKDTREFYEGRVRFLEAQNAEMMSNMEYFKEDVAKQQKLIHDLKGELRTSNNRLEAVRSRARLDDETLVKELRRGPTRSPSFGELPEAQSPCKSRLSQVDTIKREYIADKEEYKAKKLDIDRKLATLEVYMGPNQENKLKSPPIRLARSQANSIGLNIDVKQFGSSIKSKMTDSTTDYESNFEASTKELLSPLIFARNNSLTPSAGSARACLNAQLLSVKNVQGRDKSPLLSRGSFGGPKDYNSNLRTINDNQFERSRKERQDRREGLEKRMEVITQSLQSDLQKARNRAINGI